MNNNLLDQSANVIENKQMLVNIVSKRMRQLISGSRPMVEVGPRMDYADIALLEIILGKLSCESIPDLTEDLIS